MSSKENAFTTEETELGTKNGAHVENGQYSKEGYMATAPIDLVAEGKLVRKLDLHIMPLVMCLYLFSFLDRVNIGSARLYGMEEDLGLKGSQFQLAVSIFFVTYTIGEVPSNLVIKRFTPSRWLAFITTSWGIISTMTGLTQNLSGLIACRLLMGIFEAGLLPGVGLYLTNFYSRKELALRYSCLFACSGMAGALGGLISYLIGFMKDVAGLQAWRWIFILEGIPTVILGVITFFVLANDPESAKYLSEDEKHLLQARRQRQAGYNKSWDEFKTRDAIKGAKDWKVLIFCAAQFCGAAMLYGYSTFLPTIILQLGTWDRVQTNAMTIPCYALGVVTYIIAAWLSDRYQTRGLFPAGFGVVCVLGYGILLSKTNATAHYIGCLLVGMGLFVFVGMPLSYLPMNQPQYGKRAFASALQLSISNLSGVMVPFLYTADYKPRYVKGQATTLSLVAVGATVYLSMYFYFRAVNKRRRDGKEDYKIEGKTEEEIADLGDESPRFVFAT